MSSAEVQSRCGKPLRWLAAAEGVQRMRARLPDESGYVVNSGVRIHYEVHGTGQPTLLLLPTWAIVDSRHWKMQVPFLARNYRVITFDPRGNGRSDRPRDPAAYADAAFASDIRAVLDATGTERAVLAGFCTGFIWALLFATAEPQRVTASSRSRRPCRSRQRTPGHGTRAPSTTSSTPPRDGRRRTGTTGGGTGGDTSSSSCRRSPPSRIPPSPTTISWSGACKPTPTPCCAMRMPRIDRG